ncbi:MAG: metallophosphoesterase [Clostridiales bacterium]|nr:metallophosphoesterase [Clostridiales bacterium]
MKKMFIKALSVMLCVFTAASLCMTAFAADEEGREPLHFDKSGKFRILQVTDTHLTDKYLEDTLRLIGAACDREKPDLIALTGDIAMDGGKEQVTACIDGLMNVFQTRNIPVAVTFGNHDSEANIFAREELMAIYNSYPCSISVDDGEALTGCGTYLLPILSSDKKETAFNIWVFDSGDYDDEGHYANVAEDQVEWYKTKSIESERQNGKKINSIVFQHIIVPQIYDAMTKSKVWLPGSYKGIYRDEYYRLSPKYNKHRGVLEEYPCPGYYDHGQFDAALERGDVLGMFFGHDHTNSFEVNYKGIDLVASPATRFRADDALYESGMGYRIIDLNEKDTSKYETRCVYWYDFFTLADAAEMIKNKDSSGLKLLSTIESAGILRKIFNVLMWVIELL